MTAQTILPANEIKSTSLVTNSLRFDDGSSDSLTRTTETPTNADKFTFSAWVKMGAVGTDSTIIKGSLKGKVCSYKNPNKMESF